MDTMTLEQQRNWEFARTLNREVVANPASPYAGKYVAVLGKRVVASEDSLGELIGRLEAQGVDPAKAVCIEASADYDEPEYIWVTG